MKLPEDYVPLNGCSVCGRDFASLEAFDLHRVGTHQYTYSEGLKMQPLREDGRRCMYEEELEAAGLLRVSPGDSARYDSRLASGVHLYWYVKAAARARGAFSGRGGRSNGLRA